MVTYYRVTHMIWKLENLAGFEFGTALIYLDAMTANLQLIGITGMSVC